MLRAILFDMDGVLVQSDDAIRGSFNRVLEKYGVELDFTNKKKYLGRSLRDQLTVWKDEYPFIPRDLDVEVFGKEAFKYQLEILEQRLLPNAAVIDLISKAKEEGVKIAVATSSGKTRAEALLKLVGVLELLDTFTTEEDVANHKPHPDIFLKTARQLGVMPSECVVIEDAVNGIEAANAAGMKSAALITKNHTAQDFVEADAIFSDFTELHLDDLKMLF